MKIQEADWKTEKHVPVIECPDEVKENELFNVKVSVGKEISHPNTTEHYIKWIKLFFQPDGDKFTYTLGEFEFSAHGESIDGPNQGPLYTHHEITAVIKTSKPGTLYALSYCNIHGLWRSSKELKMI